MPVRGHENGCYGARSGPGRAGAGAGERLVRVATYAGILSNGN
jgi:hypothetical protein